MCQCAIADSTEVERYWNGLGKRYAPAATLPGAIDMDSLLGGGSPQLYYHDCSGRIPGHTTRAPPVGFELETNGFQFYAIATWTRHIPAITSFYLRPVAHISESLNGRSLCCGCGDLNFPCLGIVVVG